MYKFLVVLLFAGMVVISYAKTKHNEKDIEACRLVIEEYETCKHDIECPLNMELHMKFKKCV
jgi:hypothetical protein